MDLGSMTLSDLRLLRDRLGVLAEAGEALLRLPGDGGAMRFDLTPDKLVVITTHWRAPSAQDSDLAPEFEVVDPETPLAAVEAQGLRERIVEMFAGTVPPCAAAIVDPAMQDSDAQATAAEAAMAKLGAWAAAVDADMAKLDAAGPEAGCAEVGGGEGVTLNVVASDPAPAPSEIISAAPTPAAETVAPASPADAPQPTPAEAAPEVAPVGDRAGMPWTAADDQRLEQLRSAAKSVREIAGALGRPVPATRMRLSRLRKSDRDARLAKAKQDISGPAAAAKKSVAPAAQAEAPKRTGEAPVREAAQKIPAQDAQAGKAVSKPAPVAGGAGDHSKLAAGGVVRGGGGLVGERQTQDVIPPRPAWFREIDATLTAIGYRGGFTPAIDLAIVECIAGQDAPEVVADELGMEVRTMRDRFVQLTPDCVDRHGRRKVTVEDQQRLLEVLRARAEGGAL
ncbi:hypothetical protein U713_07350 [Rhodobacter capsulatus YW2]|nr:hypothetical protein U713_07350 [Rhodobacter capsulatus YW2]